MIDFDQVGKAFDGRHAVDGLSLTVHRGELVVLLGRSGSGKSTLLRLINRLIEPDRGEVRFAGQPVRAWPVEDLRRRIGYVIQSIGLFPHWTVARNIATVPTLLHWPAARIHQRVDELLGAFGLDPQLIGPRYPHELSGGQQQRVGVARALAADPEVLLMDEPFGALDPLTRADLQAELARLHRASRKTIVFVTHDVDEALRLATRIVLIDEGRIVQDGTPAQLLAHPADERVADFLGGGEAGLRLLALRRVTDALRPGPPHGPGPGDAPLPAIAADATLREALALCVARQVERLVVVNDQRRPLGMLHAADLLHLHDDPPA